MKKNIPLEHVTRRRPLTNFEYFCVRVAQLCTAVTFILLFVALAMFANHVIGRW